MGLREIPVPRCQKKDSRQESLKAGSGQDSACVVKEISLAVFSTPSSDSAGSGPGAGLPRACLDSVVTSLWPWALRHLFPCIHPLSHPTCVPGEPFGGSP